MWKTATAVQGGLIQTKESNDFQSLNQLSNFEQKIKVTIVWLQLLKWDFFLSLSLFDSKQNIFGLWAKHDIWGHYLRLWETLIDIFNHFIDQTTNQLIKLLKYEYLWNLPPTSLSPNIQSFNQENNKQFSRNSPMKIIIVLTDTHTLP